MLHLHLNDFCRFALALDQFPELGGAAESTVPSPGALTAEDVRALVAYAASRGPHR